MAHLIGFARSTRLSWRTKVAKECKNKPNFAPLRLCAFALNAQSFFPEPSADVLTIGSIARAVIVRREGARACAPPEETFAF
jgi:hypothetical protein